MDHSFPGIIVGQLLCDLQHEICSREEPFTQIPQVRLLVTTLEGFLGACKTNALVRKELALAMRIGGISSWRKLGLTEEVLSK